MENVQIALLGLGTVGTGVYKVLKAQKEEISHKVGTEIQLKKILVRNTKKAAEKLDDPSVLTTEWKSILEDPEISVVVEVMDARIAIFLAASRPSISAVGSASA